MNHEFPNIKLNPDHILSHGAAKNKNTPWTHAIFFQQPPMCALEGSSTMSAKSSMALKWSSFVWIFWFCLKNWPFIQTQSGTSKMFKKCFDLDPPNNFSNKSRWTHCILRPEASIMCDSNLPTCAVTSDATHHNVPLRLSTPPGHPRRLHINFTSIAVVKSLTESIKLFDPLMRLYRCKDHPRRARGSNPFLGFLKSPQAPVVQRNKAAFSAHNCQ